MIRSNRIASAHSQSFTLIPTFCGSSLKNKGVRY